jgi:GT2 family glycosyltransferase/glycosyltransferase involved in cell wall biosynthesis/aminoglycoside phosphotransferase (APT) family kinase protein
MNRSGAICACPNPIDIADFSGTAVTALAWAATGVDILEVRVGAPDGPLFARSGPIGSKTTGEWVRDGMTFYLQDASGGQPDLAANTIATVTMHVDASSLAAVLLGVSPDAIGADAIAAVIQQELGQRPRMGSLRVGASMTLVCEGYLPESTVVFKAALDEARSRLGLEGWACERVRRLGVPSPKVLAVDARRRSFPARYVLMEKVPGQPLSALNLTPDKLGPLLRQVGQYLRLIHSVPLEGFGYLDEALYLSENRISGQCETWPDAILQRLDVDAAYLERHGLLAADTLDSMNTVLRRYNDLLARCEVGFLLHGDLDSGQIFVDVEAQEVTGIVDFGERQSGDPAWDLSRFALRDDPERVGYLLEGYQPDESMRKSLPVKIALYRSLHVISATRRAHERGQIKEMPSWWRSYWNEGCSLMGESGWKHTATSRPSDQVDTFAQLLRKLSLDVPSRRAFARIKRDMTSTDLGNLATLLSFVSASQVAEGQDGLRRRVVRAADLAAIAGTSVYGLNILFITGQFPNPLHGGGARLMERIKIMSRNHDIYLYSSFDKDEDTAACDELGTYCRGIELVPFYAFEGSVENAKAFVGNVVMDIVHYEWPRALTNYDRSLGKCHIFTHMEAVSLRLLRDLALQPQLSSEWVHTMRELLNALKFELVDSEGMDCYVALTQQDAEFLSRFCPGRPYVVLSHGVSLDEFSIPDKDPEDDTIVFVGNYLHYPNEDAVEFFCERILGLVQDRIPDLRVYLVGADPTPSVLARHDGRRVFVTGTVDDIKPYVQQASVCIAPLITGAGYRGKVVEYAALKRACVATSIAATDLPFEDGKDIFIADDPVLFADRVVYLLRHPDAARKMAESAYKKVRLQYDNRQLVQHLYGVYAHLEREHAVQVLTAELADRERAVRALQAEVADKEQAVQSLQAELAEKEQAVEALQAEVAEREEAGQALTAEVAEKERALQAQASQLADITNSTGWAVLQTLWRVRLWVAPRGSQRERVLRLGMQGLLTWKRQGIPAVLSGARKRATEALARLRQRVMAAGRAILPYSVRRALRSTVMRKKPAVPHLCPLPDAGSQPLSQPQPGPLYDVIVFPIIDWDFRFQRPQQMAIRFAEDGHRVFYVRTTLNPGDGPTVRSIRDRVLEVQLPGPSQLSIYAEAMDERLRETMQKGFAALRREFDIVEAVCFVDLPFWTPLAFGLRDAFSWNVVYDCMDRHSGFATNMEQMLAQEDELCRGSDLVLCTSRLLLEERSRQNPRCLLVPNAVDLDHFRSSPLAVPKELQGLAGPILGYYGAISDWFDSELVRALARARPRWQFVLIGRTFGADLAPLRGLANVHLLPEKPYDALPAYLHAFDVCIIPFKRTPLTEATNPVKLFEFLSAGKAVVATGLAELQHYAEHVRLADGPEQWLTAVEEALHDRAPERVAARVDFARRNTWGERVAEVRAAILSLYPSASIIIVTYNNLDYTRLCLESIYEKTVYPHFEVIVVDNASTDGTVEFLEGWAATHPDLRVEFSDTNEGFSRANNRGFALSSGEYFVFLNNDTVVTRGWLSRLIHHLDDARVGMVGPVTNWSGNESKIEVDYDGMQEMEAFAKAYTQAHEGVTFDLDVLAFFCTAMRRSVMEEVGPLDERFGIGMFEDDDYALRVKQKGYRIVCAEDVFVHHWGRASFSQLSDEAYLQLFDENRRQFEKKWGLTWKPHQSRKVL